MGLISFFTRLFRKEELSDEEMQKLGLSKEVEKEKIEEQDDEGFEFKEPKDIQLPERGVVKEEFKFTEPLIVTKNDAKIEEDEYFEDEKELEKNKEIDLEEEKPVKKIDFNFKIKKFPKEDIKEDFIDEPLKEDFKEPIEVKKEESKINLTVNEITILGDIKIDKDKLALSKLESETETVNSYLKGLMRDISSYQENKNDKGKQEIYGKSLSTKIKKIVLHSLEIKNFLEIIEKNYYIILLEPFKKINLEHKDEKLKKTIESLERELEQVKKLEIQLTKVIAYDELLNPDKNKNYMMAIESEVSTGRVHNEISELYSILSQSLSKTQGVKAKIEKSNIIKLVQEMI